MIMAAVGSVMWAFSFQILATQPLGYESWRPEISPEEGFGRATQWHIDNRAWLDHVNL